MAKIPYGKIKVWAHRWLRGEGIPLFRNNETNRAIDSHADKIMRARTKRKRSG